MSKWLEKAQQREAEEAIRKLREDTLGNIALGMPEEPAEAEIDPVPPPIVPRVTTYELLPHPLPMHINKPEGSRKYAFGNAQTWDDITVTGHLYAQDANITVVAIAHVPLVDKGAEVTAAYYMDSLAVGDYPNSGRVAWEIGFNHTHLSPGHVVPVKREARPAVEEKIKQAKLAKKVAEEVATIDNEDGRYPNLYKSTYQAFQSGPVTYLYKEDIIVHELDARRPSKTRFKNEEVSIAGTFVKDDVIYGRPAGAVEAGYWFGVPIDFLILESELLDTELDLQTRVAIHGSLTPVERYVSVPLSRTLNSIWLKHQLDKLKTKIKE